MPKQSRPADPEVEAKIQKFRTWAMTIGRYAPSTVQRTVRRIRSLSRQLDLIHPEQEKLLIYFSNEIQNGAKPHTVNNQRKDLSAWFRFLNIQVELPVFREPPYPDPWIPSDEEAKRIIQATGRMSTRKEINLRNSILVRIAFLGGARIGEIVKINLADIQENGIRLRSEKGEAERIIGLPDSLLEDIENYVRNYRPATDPVALFTTPKGRMNYDYLRNLAGRIGAFSGVPKFHWHAARHWCATALLKGIQGSDPTDIRMVQIHLGHKSLHTTQRYTHLTSQEVAEVVRSRFGNIFQGGKKMKKRIENVNPNIDQVGLIGFSVLGSVGRYIHVIRS